jgi:hypothetical protein
VPSGGPAAFTAARQMSPNALRRTNRPAALDMIACRGRERASERPQTLVNWTHIYPPLDCWSVYETLTDGFIAAKTERRHALLMHDHARADHALGEVRELTVLCAAAAEGIALQRARWMTGNRPLPLGRLMI